MIVVSDTTPLSELAKVGRIGILRDVFGELDELISQGKRISPQFYQDVLIIAKEEF